MATYQPIRYIQRRRIYPVSTSYMFYLLCAGCIITCTAVDNFSHSDSKNVLQPNAGDRKGVLHTDTLDKPKLKGGPDAIDVRLSDTHPVNGGETNSFIVKISRGSIHTSSTGSEEDLLVTDRPENRITKDSNSRIAVVNELTGEPLDHNSHKTQSGLVIAPTSPVPAKKQGSPPIDSIQQGRKRHRSKKERSAQIRSLLREVKALRYQQALLLGHYNQLYMNQRVLSREFKDLDNRNHRMLLFQKSELQKLKWNHNNDSVLWQAGVEFLRTLTVCLEAPLQGEDCVGTAESAIKQALSRNSTLLETAVSNSRSELKTRRNKMATRGSQGSSRGSLPQSLNLASLLLTSLNLVEDSQAVLKPRDCSEIDLWTQRLNNIQVVHLNNRTTPISVMCEEGWLVVYVLPYVADDTKHPLITWDMYTYGYGDILEQEEGASTFWIGNDYLFRLTNQGNYRLRIQMRRSHDQYEVFSEYRHFRLGNESRGFPLHVSGHSGSAGDILGLFSSTPLTNQPFSCQGHVTNKRQEHYVRDFQRGWWYPRAEEDMEDNSSFLPDGFVYDRTGVMGEPCFTHLTAKQPWFCELNNKVYVNQVKMMIRPQ